LRPRAGSLPPARRVLGADCTYKPNKRNLHTSAVLCVFVSASTNSSTLLYGGTRTNMTVAGCQKRPPFQSPFASSTSLVHSVHLLRSWPRGQAKQLQAEGRVIVVRDEAHIVVVEPVAVVVREEVAEEGGKVPVLRRGFEEGG
jgi:hypothetical protein